MIHSPFARLWPGAPQPGHLAIYLVTFAAATLGGYFFALAHVPLAWVIGAMVGAAVVVWLRPASLPKLTRPVSLLVLGMSFGLGFTGPVLLAVAQMLPAIVVAGMITLGSGVLLLRPFARAAGVDDNTAFFCSVPGGVMIMPILGQERGADVAAITLSQTIRLVLVVMVVPLLVTYAVPGTGAGAFHAQELPVRPLWVTLLLLASFAVVWLMKFLPLTNPWLIGPLMFTLGLSAADLAPTSIPHWLVVVAQIGMGSTLGVKLTPRFLKEARRLLLASMGLTLVMTLLLTAVAIPLALGFGLPPEAVALGMAPGGTPEMVVTAVVLGIAVPLVVGFHLTRMIMANLLIEPLYLLCRKLGVIRMPGRGAQP